MVMECFFDDPSGLFFSMPRPEVITAPPKDKESLHRYTRCDVVFLYVIVFSISSSILSCGCGPMDQHLSDLWCHRDHSFRWWTSIKFIYIYISSIPAIFWHFTQGTISMGCDMLWPPQPAQELYDRACYEAQMRALPAELRHRGGVFLEAATWSIAMGDRVLIGDGWTISCTYHIMSKKNCIDVYVSYLYIYIYICVCVYVCIYLIMYKHTLGIPIFWNLGGSKWTQTIFFLWAERWLLDSFRWAFATRTWVVQTTRSIACTFAADVFNGRGHWKSPMSQ